MSKSNQSLLIIGLGLIGGCIAKDIQVKHPDIQISAYSRNTINLEWAKKNKLIDEVVLDLEEAISLADVIVLATPVDKVLFYLQLIARCAKSGSLVMDVGSTKEQIVKQAEKVLPKKIGFVGTHPMAGLESSGVKSAINDLFLNKPCLLTPVSSQPKYLNKAKKFWSDLGAKVSVIDPMVHDQYLAYTSHLPQMVSYALFKVIALEIKLFQIKKISGNGFRDMTRLAFSSPEMWMSICRENKVNIISALKKFSQKINQLIENLENDQFDKVEKFFLKTSTLRKKLK